MRAAFVIYCLFLALEGGLALAVTGNPFLPAAAVCAVLFYAASARGSGPWGEICRAFFAGLIAVAGPFYYRAAPLPVAMCFIALPHLLGATQCLWELAHGDGPVAQSQRMRTVVFTIAFYAAMGLVFVLLRGAEPALPRGLTTPLAAVVLLLALPAWDLARVSRLKPGSDPAPAGRAGLLRRLLLPGLVLAGVALCFSLILPPVAESLCAISPRWRAPLDAPGNGPPQQPPPPPPEDGPAQRPGLDASALTGRHELPREADLRAAGGVRLFLKLEPGQAAALLAQGPVYVRSHTFDTWKDGAWTSSVSRGEWVADEDRGGRDGWTEVRATDRPVFRHTIFLNEADGSALPALQGVAAYGLPKVYALPGDLYQIQASGNLRYEAGSAPAVWDALPGRDSLRIADPGDPALTRASGGAALHDLVFSDPLLRPDQHPLLAGRIEGLRRWFAANIQYSTVMTGNPALPPLENFLLSGRKGYCDFYATAACLILRAGGVPCRIAYGYTGRDGDPATGIWRFTDKSAHAWTEILLEETGWTVCDFTPPEHAGNLAGEDTPAAAPLDEAAYDAPERPAADRAAAEPPFSLGDRWKQIMDQLAAMNAGERLLLAVKILAAAAVAGLLLRWFFKPGKPRRPSPFAAGEAQPAYFAEFLRRFCDAGFPRPAGATPREYFEFLRSRGAAGSELAPMIDYHYAHRYAGAAPDPALEDRWLALVREAAQRLRQTQSRT